mmetsp:Transcript_131597/g.366755  ORF Transcript_131597/g.366755 Transcript_131597/m.366755 type:complete len:204 (-) Transcript_131597:100-711(-)
MPVTLLNLQVVAPLLAGPLVEEKELVAEGGVATATSKGLESAFFVVCHLLADTWVLQHATGVLLQLLSVRMVVERLDLLKPSLLLRCPLDPLLEEALAVRVNQGGVEFIVEELQHRGVHGVRRGKLLSKVRHCEGRQAVRPRVAVFAPEERELAHIHQRLIGAGVHDLPQRFQILRRHAPHVVGAAVHGDPPPRPRWPPALLL